MTSECPVAAPLAASLRRSRDKVTGRWLERVADREAFDPNEVFPTEELLDHVPLLVDAIADFLENPAEELTVEDIVVGKAIELGELRHRQGVRPNEILKEFEILGGILLHFMATEVEAEKLECTPAQALICAHRLHRAIAVIQRMTTTHYLRLQDQRINEREQRLRGFNRMISHEMKNRIGAVSNAALMLQEGWLGEEQQARMIRMLVDNGAKLTDILKNLLELSRIDPTESRGRDLPLAKVVGETIRQIRDVAQAHDVEVQWDDLPDVAVNAPAVELALTNYISNAIKYSDPAKPERWVRINADLHGEPDQLELGIEVEDNGVGVPEDARDQLFKPFFRSDHTVEIEGSGIGLSIVRDTIESLGGRVWARFDGSAGGSVFGLAVPSRRQREAGEGEGRGGEGRGEGTSRERGAARVAAGVRYAGDARARRSEAEAGAASADTRSTAD